MNFDWFSRMARARIAPVAGRGLRGRVSRVSLVKRGQVSVVVRFGLEELEAAKALLPGALLEVVEVREEKAGD